MSATAFDVKETIRKLKKPASIRQSEHTLRWVLAHDPPVVWEDASRAFAETVREKTNGDIEVDLATLQEFNMETGEAIDRVELIRCLGRGEIEMAHTYVSALGVIASRFWALELPFLFRDYEHAENVLESSIATRFLDELKPHGIRGIGFAYSGGFRIIPSSGKRLQSLADFQDMSIRVAENPIPGDMFASMGASAVSAPLEKIPELTRAGTIDAAEITYVRFMGTGLDKVYNVVNETSHSLFMTAMAINEEFFNTLSDEHQAAVMEAGQTAARIERAESISEENRIIDSCPDQGIELVRMNAEDHAEFRERSMAVYDKYAPLYGEDLIQSISDHD